MRKLLLFTAILSSLFASAQNLQLHYDLGSDRKYFTTTLEMFKPDKLGNTYFFIDMDYNSGGSKGVTMAYWEIARVLRTEKMPLGLHVEYDGGFGRYRVGNSDVAYGINNSWLAGVDYSINAKDYSKGIRFKVLYKYIQDKHKASYQLTTVWYMKLLNDKLLFTGFADFWREDSDFDFDGTVDAEYIFISEPQIWFYLNEHFCIGSELELSNNFGGKQGFYARPTIAAKWIF